MSSQGSEEIVDKADGRAVPLPEERSAEYGGEDRKAEAETILADSENRVAEATFTDKPADAAQEHRRSEDTAD